MNDISNIKFEVVEHRSPLYKKSIYVRYKLLRQPLGLKFTKQQMIEEEDQIHIIGEIGESVIASLVFKPFPDQHLRMRQVTVLEEYQGYGIGKRIVQFSEVIARERGCKEIFLHARKHVIPFYLKLGYKLRGKEFWEVGLPHREMYKEIG